MSILFVACCRLVGVFVLFHKHFCLNVPLAISIKRWIESTAHGYLRTWLYGRFRNREVFTRIRIRPFEKKIEFGTGSELREKTRSGPTYFLPNIKIDHILYSFGLKVNIIDIFKKKILILERLFTLMFWPDPDLTIFGYFCRSYSSSWKLALKHIPPPWHTYITCFTVIENIKCVFLSLSRISLDFLIQGYQVLIVSNYFHDRVNPLNHGILPKPYHMPTPPHNPDWRWYQTNF